MLQYDIASERAYNGFLTAAYRWQSRTQYNLNQDPRTVQAAYGILNLGAGLKDKTDTFKLSFLVNNVFGKSYAQGMGNNLATGTWSSRAPNPVVTVSTTTWTPPRDYQRYYALRADLAF